MKRLLLISYVFPPAGGAGVQRALKMVKYLPAHGWQAVVVTPRRPSVPVVDRSYLRDLPPGLVVERLPSLEPGAGGDGSAPASAAARLRRLAVELAFPDRYVLWLATALPGTLAAIRRHRVQVVMVTAPPFSSFILGAAAAGLAGLPLVLDFRDDWSGFFTKGFQAHGGGRMWKRAVLSLERRLVRRAARVVGTTRAMCRRLQRLHGGPPGKYVWIPNGYDPDDFRFLAHEPLRPPAPDEPIRLLHSGTVFQSHPLDELWAALARLERKERARFTVEVVGRVVPGMVVDPGLPGLRVRRLPYEPHQAALRRMARAHVLVATLADIPGLSRMVPGKLFEYLAVRRPVLMIAPPGEATAIVEATGAGVAVFPGQSQRLARVLRGWLQHPPHPLGPPPRLFDRRHLAGRLAAVLEAVAAG